MSLPETNQFAFALHEHVRCKRDVSWVSAPPFVCGRARSISEDIRTTLVKRKQSIEKKQHGGI